MAVITRVETYDGQLIAVGGVAYIQTDRSMNRDEYPLLSGIDIYGRTAFNKGQARTLKREVARLIEHEGSRELVESLADVVRMCDRASVGTHRLLWFIGD